MIEIWGAEHCRLFLCRRLRICVRIIETRAISICPQPNSGLVEASCDHGRTATHFAQCCLGLETLIARSVAIRLAISPLLRCSQMSSTGYNLDHAIEDGARGGLLVRPGGCLGWLKHLDGGTYPLRIPKGQ